MVLPVSTVLSFVAAVAVLMVIPGPAMIYVVTVSADHGRRLGLMSVAGICLGEGVLVALATFGLTALLAASEAAFTVVRLAGAAYLIFLGARRLATPVAPMNGDRHETQVSGRRLVGRGAIVSVLNPKDALFFLAFLPQFVTPGPDPVTGQILVLGMLFVVVAATFDGVYALAGAQLGLFLHRHRSLWASQRWVIGGIYVTLGSVAALTGSRTAAKPA